MLKVDPRTGMIISGNRKTPRSPSSPIRKKTEQAIIQQAPTMDLTAIMAMAVQIGKTIAAEMKDAQTQQILVREEVVSRLGGESATIHGRPAVSVEIDESIADVGIGKTEKLKKGELSATLAKEETKTDNSLSQSKRKLQAIKGIK